MYFEHDYTEEEEGKRVRRAMQTERFPADYSQRVYGGGGFLPRFVSHHRGAGNASPMYVYRYDMMRELLEKFRDWDGDRHEALMVEYVDPTTGLSVYKTMTFFMQMLRPGERTLPLEAERESRLLAVRGPRLQRDRRPARRLGAVRHFRRSRRHLVRARQHSPTRSRRSCSWPATSRPSRRWRSIRSMARTTTATSSGLF